MREVLYTIIMRLISWIHSRGSETLQNISKSGKDAADAIKNYESFLYQSGRISCN